jgi:hypothetical protein
VAHDGVPYKFGATSDLFGAVKEANMFLETKRTENISTSQLSKHVAALTYDAYIQHKTRIARGFAGN